MLHNAASAYNLLILQREMIVFTSAGKPVLRSDKSTIQRKPTLTLYHKEIEDVYAAVNKNAVTVTPLRSLERDEVAQMVASIVQSIMGSGTPLRSKTQLTDVGLDSLRATLVRASILSALRNAQAAGVAGESEKIASQITQNFAFEHSSIKEMTVRPKFAGWCNSFLADGSFCVY